MDKSFYLKLFLWYLGVVLALVVGWVIPTVYYPEQGILFLWIPMIGGAVLFAIFVMVGIGHAVYHDAKRRGMPGLAWALIAVMVPYLLGVIVYLIVREPVKATCGACGRQLSAADAFCPHCGHRLHQPCPSCDQPVNPGARFCAHCGAKIAA